MLYYSLTLKEAEECYKKYCNTDPFPDIKPALLNSSDIQDYVATTGMIFPFNLEKEYFKPASYGIGFSGDYLYWDIKNGESVKIKKTLKEGEKFTLKRNSITYVKLQPYFQFPNYIAARFNLQIKHVYRGLLLGTGPLVDPGYVGYLNIPIHNLTNEDYEIEYGEQLIWMEFTKLSPNENWNTPSPSPKREGIFYEFKSDSKNKDLEFFLHKAHPNAAIISTMQGVKADIEKVESETKELNAKTKEVNDNASKATNSFNRAINISIVAIFLTLGAIVITLSITIYQTITIHNKTIDYLKDYDKKIQDEHQKFLEQQNGIIELKKQIIDLNEKIKNQDEEIEKLRK